MNTKTKDKPEAEEKAPGTDVARAAGTDVAVVDFGDDAGRGMENVTAEELRVPFLVILQSNSPQCKRPSEGGIAGATAGMIFNTSTGELFDGEVGLEMIPVERSHQFLEFTPRNLGGGFVAVYSPDDPKVLALREKQGKFGRLWTGTKRDDEGRPLDGTEITETFSLYCLMGNERFRAVVSFVSTQIKKYQAFMQRQTNMKYRNVRGDAVQPPLWAHRWLLQTAFEKNKKGDFYGWRLSLLAKDEKGIERPYPHSLIKTSDPDYADARTFNEMLRGGRARADYAKAGGASDGAQDGEDPPM